MAKIITRPQSFKRQRANLPLLAIIALALSMGGNLLQAQSAKPAASAASATGKPALSVVLVKPQLQDLPKRLAANGNVTAWQEAIVSAEVNGLRLAEVRASVGDAVKKGQVLANFDASGVQADVLQAQATVLEAEASAAEASANAERARSLQGTGALSTQQILQATTAEQATKARVQAAKALLNAQQLRLRNAQVVAPDAGIISARMATVGGVAGAGQELFRLIRQGRLEWRAEVTASELSKVKAGTNVTVTAQGAEPVTGRVRTLAPTIDPLTRNGLVYVDLPANEAVKAGMFARGEFELGSSRVLTLPQTAVVLREGFSYVFRLEPNNRVSQVKVQLGARVADRLEMIAGVKADDQVVQSGAAFLTDGDSVRVVPSAPAPAASK